MSSISPNTLPEFQSRVGLKFQLFNSLFLSLPFDRVEKTGILLSLFLSNCEEGYASGQGPLQIVEDFFNNSTSIIKEKEKIDLLFRFVQYAERQVVLFDALEDAAFREVNDFQGAGTLKHLESSVLQNNKQAALEKKLRDFNVRLVLTAHPTQFYPGSVLGIINDLTQMIRENKIENINTYLQQLGKTPFIKKQKPTPFDEALSLIWYLENVFYEAAGNIVSDLSSFTDETFFPVRMGFWSGGDRDGNPYVTVETTLQVAAALRHSILNCYYRDVRQLKRRLTFSGIEAILAELEQRLYENITSATDTPLSKKEILAPLGTIRDLLIDQYNGLFVRLVSNLIYKVQLFGLYFASLDIRQDSHIHARVLEYISKNNDALPNNYTELSASEKMDVLSSISKTADADKLEDELAKDTLNVVAAIKTIQQQNGPASCERYIISHCQSAVNAMEVFGLLLLGGWTRDDMPVDIVPLFETVTDLKNAAGVMRELYEYRSYREHLARRRNTQTVMLGFSDGTKDGGYLMANWSIYKAKSELTEVSKDYGIDVIFFDGRGGPPARGGGKTHKFYSSMGENVSNRAIELTVQGQTISSNFANVDAAQYNIEQLVHAGVYNHIFDRRQQTFTPDEQALMQRLADESYAAYEQLKNDPAFLEYLLHASPLPFYGETNVGSRPVKRGGSKKLELEDLRAIPFVGAWSQIKQNVPGYYGLGAAFRTVEKDGLLDDVIALFKNNAFFRALMDNCEMAMQKSFFPLTGFLSDHPVFGELWRKIHDEFELTKHYLLLISGKTDLMADYPVEKQSIEMRERIMLPLTTIQQFGLIKNRELADADPDARRVYEKLILRCSFGIINAGRNSV